MKIVNGKWVSEHGDQLNDFDMPKFKKIGEKVTAIFGSNINHNKIDIILGLENIDSKNEIALGELLNNKKRLKNIRYE